MNTALPAFPELPLWKVVWKLMRLRAQIYVSGFKRAKKAKKFWMIVGWLAVLITFGAILTGTILLLRLLESPVVAAAAGDFRPLIEGIPSLIIAGAFLTILLTSFGVLLQGLYLAGDMDFLLTSPVPIRAVFISKLLLAVLPNFTIIAFFGIPILFGIGIGAGYNLLFYPLALIVLAFLSLAAAGISSLLVMAVVRVIPAKRVAEILAFVGAIFSMTCSQWGNISRGMDFSQTPDMLSARMGTIERALGPYSPLAWAGRGLVDIGSGHWLTGILFILLTIALSGGMFWFALVTAERLYYTGWSSIQGVAHKKKPVRAQRGSGAIPVSTATGHITARPSIFARFLPAQTRAVISKDWLMLRRDLRSMSQVVTPLIFGVIYGFLLLRDGGPGPGRGEAPEAFSSIMAELLTYGGVGIAVFIGWSLLSRLALMAFSAEGKSYWLVKVAPVHTGKLLLGKFIIAFLPSLALSWIFWLGISLLQRPPFSTIWYGFPVLALINAGMAGISLAFGITSAKLDWTDPRRMSSGGWSGCLSGLLTFIYIGGILVVFLGPPILLTGLLEVPLWIGQVIGLGVGGLICLLCTILPILLTKKRVDAIGEGVL